MIMFLALMPDFAPAGQYHTEEQVCSDCHTAHFSQHGKSPEGAEPGGPFEHLLLFSSPTKLCLSCHDGSDIDAPDVLEPVSTIYSPDEFSAAGFFEFSGFTPSSRGHDLGVMPAQVPFSGMASASLSCASCHNPHGNKNYRNLKTSPGIGKNPPLQQHDPSLPTDHVFQRIQADGKNPEDTYRRSNIGYRTGISEWCAGCHDRLLPNQAGTPPAHFQSHPVDVSIRSGGPFHVDSRHWQAGTGAGFGDATGDGLPGVPRVPFQTPSATSYETARSVSTDNEVFCGTCHFAHGGPYEASATWPFRSTKNGTEAYAPCQQCHNE